MPIDASDPADDARSELDELDVDDLGADEFDDDLDEFDDDDLEVASLEEAELTGDAALVARARKKYGIGGAMLAGGMLGLDRMLTGKVKQEAPVEWEAPGEPLDIDRKGIDVPLEDERIVRSRPGPAAAAGAVSRRVTRRRRP